jgi:hypothetical protein
MKNLTVISNDKQPCCIRSDLAVLVSNVTLMCRVGVGVQKDRSGRTIP